MSSDFEWFERIVGEVGSPSPVAEGECIAVFRPRCSDDEDVLRGNIRSAPFWDSRGDLIIKVEDDHGEARTIYGKPGHDFYVRGLSRW